jgi:hypothetical protein
MSKSVVHKYGLFSLHSRRYDSQLSRLRGSVANPALELPIPIIDIPLQRFSEPNLRQESQKKLLNFEQQHILPR